MRPPLQSPASGSDLPTRTPARAAARTLLVTAVALTCASFALTGPGPSSSRAPAPASSPGPASVQVSEAASAQVLAPARKLHASAKTSGWHIGPARRAQVDAAYQHSWEQALRTPTGWNGSSAGCVPGTISAVARARMAAAVNFARRLNGLRPVGYRNAHANASAQAAARLMHANDRLSHTPPRTWACWSRAGYAAAGVSNIGLRFGTDVTVGEYVNDYFDEPGAANTAVGHRRWLLLPEARTFGFGATSKASAIRVVGVARSRSNPNPAWVSWPSRGYFPDTMEPQGRWSLSSGSTKVSFARARVQVTRNGVHVPVRTYRPHNGYGRPTLVFQLPASAPDSGTYRVTVSRIKKAGGRKALKVTYPVVFFTPGS